MKRVLRAAFILCLVPASIGVYGASANVPASTAVYKIALSQSFNNNDWESEQRFGFIAESKTPPYNKRVVISQYVAGADPQKQVQQQEQMIASGVNAIVTFPSNPQALTPVIRLACAKKVVIIAWSSDMPLICPYAYQINTNETTYGAEMAQWLARAIHFKGNVIISSGIAGTTAGTQRVQGARAVFAKYPGIHVVGSYNGNWDNSTAQRGMAQEIASHPKIDGVYSETGVGVVNALITAHRKLVPVTGEGENGLRVDLLNPSMVKQGLKGYSGGNPPYTAAYALKEAVAILDGQKIPQKVVVPVPSAVTGTLKKCKAFGANQRPPSNCNTYPASLVSGEFFSDFYDAKYVPELCLAAVEKGTPCKGQKAKAPITLH